MTMKAEVFAERPLYFASSSPRRDLGRSFGFALTCAVAALCFANSAVAQVRTNALTEQSRLLRGQSVTRTQPPPGKYQSETGLVFYLGREGSTSLLRFENSAETWALRPSSAPRGTTVYRNDAGDQVMRVTASGAITVYTSRHPGGSPASQVGPAINLAPPSMGPVQMFNLMTRRSSLVSEHVGRLVRINVEGEESVALCIEALIVTTDAIIRIARSPSARPFLERLRSITIVEGARATVTYYNGDLRVVVDPRRGIAGRPSSARVIRAVIPQE